MTEEKYNTKDVKHINEKNQEYIAEGNRMTKEKKYTIDNLIGDCNKYHKALEEIREMILYCEDEYNCDRCKYHDNCLVDDDTFPDFSKALVNKINEVLQ